MKDCEHCFHFMLQNYETCPILKKEGVAWVYPIGKCRNSNSFHYQKFKLPGWKICYMFQDKNEKAQPTPVIVPEQKQKSIFDIKA